MLENWFRSMMKSERGSSIAMVGVSLIGLFAIAGLAMDGGMMYMTKSHLQKTANAAALSGAQELLYEEETVEEVVQAVLTQHDEDESLEQLDIKMRDRVTVHLMKEIPLTLTRFIGFDTVEVRAYAAAELATMGEAYGAAPLGIDERIQIDYEREYTLKVDEKDVDQGNFGILALGKRGGDMYEINLKYGFADAISIGEVLETEAGNITNKTKNGVKHRIDSCHYPEGETHHRDCSRILLIPVYQPKSQNSNGRLKEVVVTGFAYFYLSKPMDDQDKTIRGKFVKRAGTGIHKPEAVNREAYVIKLTE